MRRNRSFAQAWGYGTLSVRNLFALRATDPKQLRRVADPIGPLGKVELAAATTADLVVAAWGAGVPFDYHHSALRTLAGKPLWCLGVTKQGHPRHPLYVRSDQALVPFGGRA